MTKEEAIARAEEIWGPKGNVAMVDAYPPVYYVGVGREWHGQGDSWEAAFMDVENRS